MQHTDWYKDAVIYQIYPKSFKDGNGDGLGDIPGIISKLDYLKELGVNCVWLSPIYDSPQADNGYDIANYRDIYPPFGTLDDFKKMLEGMHERGIRLIMDLVVNHTSDQHPWFQEAIKDKNSPYRDFYYIKKGRDNGKKPPNKWSAFFGGSAWSKVPRSEDEWYLHLFTKEQPDLNWENPRVREEVKDILRYWLDMGVDGFRCDVITLISKDQRFLDGKWSPAIRGKEYYVNGPRLHEYLHSLYEDVYANYDCMTVGETVLSTIDQARLLVDPKREELSMVFNFDHTDSDNFFGVKYFYRKFKLTRLKKRVAHWQNGLRGCGWNSLFIENHDQRRSVGRFGTDDGVYRKESAKMLATTYFFLQGTPFIYEGQEIGMTNGDFGPNDFVDIETYNIYEICRKHPAVGLFLKKYVKQISRDNARTPVQWSDEEYAGFSTEKPWIKVNENHKSINVKESLEDKDSIFHYFQKVIELRKGNDIVKNGDYVDLFPKSNKVYAYTRSWDGKKMTVISNFTAKEVKFPYLKNCVNDEMVLTNYKEHKDLVLLPYETRVYISR